MLRLLKILFVLAVLIAAAVLGYAYLGDLSPEQEDVSVPVTLDGN
jgi:Tfp pilus assembly protein PilO